VTSSRMGRTQAIFLKLHHLNYCLIAMWQTHRATTTRSCTSINSEAYRDASEAMLQRRHTHVKSVNTHGFAPMVRRLAARSVLHYTTDAIQNRALSGGRKTLSICALFRQQRPSAANEEFGEVG
jgi:hypothetical protein